MTREEFMDEYYDLDDLMQWCRDERCNYFEQGDPDLFSEDEMDDYIDRELLPEWAENKGWRELLDFLSDIPTGYEYYRYDGYDWYSVDDDDINTYLNEVADWAEENGYFDPEEDDEEERVEPAVFDTSGDHHSDQVRFNMPPTPEEPPVFNDEIFNEILSIGVAATA